MVKNLVITGAALVLIWGIVSVFDKDEWSPFYYPNAPSLIEFSSGPTVDSLEQCRDWVNGEAVGRGQAPGEYDYECGLNCKFDDGIGVFVCEETVQ